MKVFLSLVVLLLNGGFLLGSEVEHQHKHGKGLEGRRDHKQHEEVPHLAERFKKLAVNKKAKMTFMEKAKIEHRRDLKVGPRANPAYEHTVVFAVKQSNLDKLEEILNDVSNPKSENFGKHLTRKEINKLTGNPKATKHVEDYLARHNVEIVKKTPNGEYITAKAPVSTWEEMFDTKFYDYKQTHNPKMKIVRTPEYSLPEFLVDHVSTVFDTVHFPDSMTLHRMTSVVKKADDKTQRLFKNEIKDKKKKIEAVLVNGYVTPAWLNSYYSITSNTGNSLASQSVYESINQTYSPSDLTFFQTYFELPLQGVAVDIGGHSNDNACAPQNGGFDNCGEANLDVQYIMAVSQVTPTVYYYWNETDWMLAWVTEMASMENPPLVNSISYSSYELDISTSYSNSFNTEAMKLGAMGVTLLSASGDDGVAGYAARDMPQYCGYYPQFPASSPYVTAVGGTQGPEQHNGWPEVVCQSNTGGVITSGGGFSTLNPAPSWQQTYINNYFAYTSTHGGMTPAPGYSTTGRGYPDVSLIASNYLISTYGNLSVVYGTSASTPSVAGMVSLVNAARLAAGKSALGWINPSIYELYPYFSMDISSGINNCVAEGYSGVTCCSEGFYAAPGWDPTTGVGSVNYALFYDQFFALGDNPNQPTLNPTIKPGDPTPPPTIAPTPQPTFTPTGVPTLAPGWVTSGGFSGETCDGTNTLVAGAPTGQCFVLYNSNILAQGSAMYTCDGLMIYYTEYSTMDCDPHYVVFQQPYFQGCISTDIYYGDDYYYYSYYGYFYYGGYNSYSLQCASGGVDSNSGSLPLPNDQLWDTLLFFDSEHGCNNAPLSSFTAMSDGYCFTYGYSGYTYSYMFKNLQFLWYYDDNCSGDAAYTVPMKTQCYNTWTYSYYGYPTMTSAEEIQEESKIKKALEVLPAAAKHALKNVNKQSTFFKPSTATDKKKANKNHDDKKKAITNAHHDTKSQMQQKKDGSSKHNKMQVSSSKRGNEHEKKTSKAKNQRVSNKRGPHDRKRRDNNNAPDGVTFNPVTYPTPAPFSFYFYYDWNNYYYDWNFYYYDWNFYYYDWNFYYYDWNYYWDDDWSWDFNYDWDDDWWDDDWSWDFYYSYYYYYGYGWYYYYSDIYPFGFWSLYQGSSPAATFVPTTTPTKTPVATPFTQTPTFKPFSFTPFPTNPVVITPLPTSTPVTISFLINQKLNGVDSTTYLSDLNNNNQALFETSVTYMTDVTYNDLTYVGVVNNAHVKYNHITKQTTTTPSVNVTYSVTLDTANTVYTSGNEAYNSLKNQLNTAINSGAFDNTLHSWANYYNAQALTTVTSAPVTTSGLTTQADSSNDDNNDDNSQAAAIGAGLTLAFVIVIAGGLFAYYQYVWKPKQLDKHRKEEMFENQEIPGVTGTGTELRTINKNNNNNNNNNAREDPRIGQPAVAVPVETTNPLAKGSDV